MKNNPDRLLVSVRKWQKKNREKLKERARIYARTHKEQIYVYQLTSQTRRIIMNHASSLHSDTEALSTDFIVTMIEESARKKQERRKGDDEKEDRDHDNR